MGAARIVFFLAGLLLVGLQVVWAESPDQSVRYVARSWRGALIYMLGCALILAAVLT